MAALFHMSAALAIPALFFQPNKRWHIITISLGVFVLVFIEANFVSGYLENYISVLEDYQKSGFGDDAPNPFAGVLLLDWAMIAVSLIMWKNLSLLMKRIAFLELIGMAIFYGAFGFPVMAHRFRMLFNVFWVIFVADGLHQKDVKIPVAGFAMASIVYYGYMDFIFIEDFY